MKYTIYNILTGEITRIVICNNPEEQLNDDESYLEGEFSDIDYIVSNGEAVIKPTPAFDADTAALKIRIKRNKLLLASDFTQLPDSKVDKYAWAIYRDDLRNITAQSTFPENVVWPVAPT